MKQYFDITLRRVPGEHVSDILKIAGNVNIAAGITEAKDARTKGKHQPPKSSWIGQDDFLRVRANAPIPKTNTATFQILAIARKLCRQKGGSVMRSDLVAKCADAAPVCWLPLREPHMLPLYHIGSALTDLFLTRTPAWALRA